MLFQAFKGRMKYYPMNLRKNAWGCWLFFTCSALLFLCGISSVVQADPTITVKGRMQVGTGQTLPAEELSVVILKFVLDEKGELTTKGPIGRTKANAKGEFIFSDLPFDDKGAYRLGTRLGGELVSTDYFFMKSGAVVIEQNIQLPGLSHQTELLNTPHVNVIAESSVGLLIITQVVEVINPSSDNVVTDQTPITLSLVDGFTNFHWFGDTEKEPYELKGNQLSIKKTFAPGPSNFVFQYQLQENWISREVQINLPEKVKTVSIFTPVDRLQISTAGSQYQGVQKFDKQMFQRWDVELGNKQVLLLNITGIPITQKWFLVLSGVIGVLILCGLGIFYQRRLKGSTPIGGIA